MNSRRLTTLWQWKYAYGSNEIGMWGMYRGVGHSVHGQLSFEQFTLERLFTALYMVIASLSIHVENSRPTAMCITFKKF